MTSKISNLTLVPLKKYPSSPTEPAPN